MRTGVKLDDAHEDDDVVRRRRVGDLRQERVSSDVADGAEARDGRGGFELRESLAPGGVGGRRRRRRRRRRRAGQLIESEGPWAERCTGQSP